MKNRGTTTSAARGTYFGAEERLNIGSVALAQTSDPAERGRLLAKMADAASDQARVYRDAFGPDPMREEGGRDMAESCGHSATLYRLLSDVEYAVVDPGHQRTLDPHSDLESCAWEVLARMARTPDLAARMRLLADLADTVEPIVGGQAVDTLWCLPSPGHRGWLTLAEKDELIRSMGVRFRLKVAVVNALARLIRHRRAYE
ncbi:MAG: hypothetical protein EPO06_11825 [Burkholderiaceae bacterium]|nr:MAG: hypothetical protein EPO06_11825 [Burkholderiaceae bacterium]